jgi:DNA-binding MarR family transcriptional regulator
MTTKNRLTQLEKQKPKVKMTWKEFVTMSDIEWERSMNTLAGALGVTRAEAEKALKELNHDKK